MKGAVAATFQLIYALFLIVVGTVGLFCVRWELQVLYGLDLAQVGDAASFVSQYRFLKAVELAFGVFAFLQRREILAGGVECLIFLIGLAAGILARSLAWVSDGTPNPVFLLFMAFEIVTLLLVWAHTSRDPDQS